MSLPPFQHLVDEHWRDVARLAHALAPGHGDDVAQQAWTQALAAYPRLTHARNLRSWLLTITHRCAMDHHRAARRTTPHEDPSLLAQAPTLPPPEAPDGDLWARVGALPARQRDAVVLRFVGDEIPSVPLYRRTLTWVTKKKVQAVQWPNDAPELRWLRVQP